MPFSYLGSCLPGIGKMLDSSTASDTTIYFGYGSNLWLHQMKMRCPTSEYLGVARIIGYRWMINERGYANIVETTSPPEREDRTRVPVTNVVYALVYRLQAKDERRLDCNEGVPIAYKKEYLDAEFWPTRKDGKAVDVTQQCEKRKMLVYINRQQTQDRQPKKEYIYRMNMGIKDAVKAGVPPAYVEKVMRKYIPEKDDGDLKEMAEKQALVFEDEA